MNSDKLYTALSELKQCYRMKDAMRIDQDGILEVRLVENGRERWRIVCPETSWKAVIWQIHSFAHFWASRTVDRIKLTWYWPGMVAETRQKKIV